MEQNISQDDINDILNNRDVFGDYNIKCKKRRL